MLSFSKRRITRVMQLQGTVNVFVATETPRLFTGMYCAVFLFFPGFIIPSFAASCLRTSVTNLTSLSQSQ